MSPPYEFDNHYQKALGSLIVTTSAALSLTPFGLDFFQRGLLGGALVAILCGVVGTWVVIRGMAFLGEALAHGMLPGVALATVLGLPVLAGGALSAVAMSIGIGALQRRARLSYDTSIGLLFVSMLALGVHLFHGAWSSVRSLGVSPTSAQPLKRKLSLAIAVLVWAGFTAIPVSVFFGIVK
jgi:uncharacterized membrane protein